MVINPSVDRTERCLNCHNHFSELRPHIKEVRISKHFKRDYEDYDSVIKDILSCEHSNFNELHKYEEHVDNGILFRAKKGKTHFAYIVDKGKNLVFLRAFNNFKDYKKFLDDKKEIKRSSIV